MRFRVKEAIILTIFIPFLVWAGNELLRAHDLANEIERMKTIEDENRQSIQALIGLHLNKNDQEPDKTN